MVSDKSYVNISAFIFILPVKCKQTIKYVKRQKYMNKMYGQMAQDRTTWTKDQVSPLATLAFRPRTHPGPHKG